ncbi:MAG: hypothetical protein GY869_31760 [Planctomycetes bacterium]|nr:hypothetical protein [Planctomycetota bacterium]
MLEYPIYVLLGQSHTKVKAEYTGLENQKTAVIIVGQSAIDFEEPYARMDLALATEQALTEYVKGIELADQEEIQNFQRSRFDWYSLPVSDIINQFQVERLLYVELIQFTIREPESVNLLRGHIWAQLRIFEKESDTPNIPVLETEADVIFPEQGPSSYSEAARFNIRQQSIGLFALEVARKFHDHKKEVDR